MPVKADRPEARVIDFHLHTFRSDGALGPAELSRRAQAAGYAVMGVADHVDAATLFENLSTALLAAESLNGEMGDFLFLPGVELTHVPPAKIADLVKKARDLGASHVVVHGESIVEPVAPGTNLAGIKAGADILAHPGLLTEEEAALAAENGVRLELSGRGGHGLANGLVARLARKHGAKLLVNSDGHMPGDLLSPTRQKHVALGAGLGEAEFAAVMADALALAAQFRSRLRL